MYTGYCRPKKREETMSCSCMYCISVITLSWLYRVFNTVSSQANIVNLGSRSEELIAKLHACQRHQYISHQYCYCKFLQKKRTHKETNLSNIRPSSNVAFLSRRIQCKWAKTIIWRLICIEFDATEMRRLNWASVKLAIFCHGKSSFPFISNKSRKQIH